MQKNASAMKIPPQNIEAEKALLGSVMLRRDAMHEIIDFINSDSFYTERHRLIWNAMFELFTKAQPIDLLSLSSRLKEKNELERSGSGSYLAELVNIVPSSGNIVHYAQIVQKKAMMRKLIGAAEHIEGLGYEDSHDLEHMLDAAEKAVYDVTNVSSAHKFIELKDTLHEAWEQIDRLHKSKDELRGVPTGFKAIDNKLAGLQKSDLIILAARPSCGKTSLALDIARRAAINHKIPVGIFSLEMSAQQLVQRMLSAESQIDSWKLRTGRNLSETGDFQNLRDAMDRLSQAPIFIDDQPGNNILKMRSVARRLKSEKALGLIVVDYLQLMVPVNSRATDSLVQQVTEISRSLKNLARELNIPVLALSQLSRAVEQRGGKPRLSDLRDSGSIEQDADVVMFIHRERDETGEQAKSREAEILIEKHRNGPTGFVKLIFDAEKATFLDVEKADFGDFEPSAQTF